MAVCLQSLKVMRHFRLASYMANHGWCRLKESWLISRTCVMAYMDGRNLSRSHILSDISKLRFPAWGNCGLQWYFIIDDFTLFVYTRQNIHLDIDEYKNFLSSIKFKPSCPTQQPAQLPP